MIIQCFRYTPVNRNTLIGYASFYIPDLDFELHDCQLHQKNGGRWINFPSKEYTTSEGEKKYYQLFRIRDKNRLENFTRDAFKAVEDKNNSSNDLPF